MNDLQILINYIDLLAVQFFSKLKTKHEVKHATCFIESRPHLYIYSQYDNKYEIGNITVSDVIIIKDVKKKFEIDYSKPGDININEALIGLLEQEENEKTMIKTLFSIKMDMVQEEDYKIIQSLKNAGIAQW